MKLKLAYAIVSSPLIVLLVLGIIDMVHHPLTILWYVGIPAGTFTFMWAIIYIMDHYAGRMANSDREPR